MDEDVQRRRARAGVLRHIEVDPLSRPIAVSDLGRAARRLERLAFAAPLRDVLLSLIHIFEMAADMPEMLDDAADWRFKTYQQHFADSVFTHKDLAVWAYEHAPEAWRAPLDRCTAALRRRIEETLPHLQALQQSGEAEALAAEALSLIHI